MLYIDKATILKFDLEMLKKHRRAIQFIAVLLFIVGLLCISFPFVSGDILSTVVGALLICSGIALIVGLFSNRSHNFWPVLSGFLVAVAYLLIAILHPRTGAGHFCHCGIYCRFVLCCRGYSPDELVSSAFNERQLATARYWCAGYRHCLDIPWCNADGVCNAGFHTGGN
ncbi:acid-resistance membrane protein [Shigella dysenteriae]|nr:acid-resistance membrane protein [Shigella dysenteriae]